MSRSYKKHPVCTRRSSSKEYKQRYNRSFRRKLNQGRLDNANLSKGNLHRKLENFTWIADNYKFYNDGYQSETFWGYYDSRKEEEYQQYMSYYVRK